MKFITIILAIAPLLAIAAPIKSSHQTVRKTDYSQAQFPAATLPYSIHRRQTENTGAGDEDEEIIPSGTGVLSGVVPVPTDPPEAGGQQQQAEAGPAEPEQAKTQTKSCANGSTKVQQGEDAAPPKNGMQAEAGEAKPQAPEGGDEVPAPAPKGQKQAKAESPAPEGEGEDTPPKGQKEAEGEPPAPEGEGGVVPPKGQKQEDPTAEAPEEEGEAAPPKGNKQAEVKPQAPGEEGEAPPPKGNDKPDAEPKEPEDPKV